MFNIFITRVDKKRKLRFGEAVAYATATLLCGVACAVSAKRRV
jgi:hypothetical protein